MRSDCCCLWPDAGPTSVQALNVTDQLNVNALRLYHTQWFRLERVETAYEQLAERKRLSHIGIYLRSIGALTSEELKEHTQAQLRTTMSILIDQKEVLQVLREKTYNFELDDEWWEKIF